jgi:hypothetical protein
MSGKGGVKVRLAQLKSLKLWKDSVPIGLGIFGVVSGVASVIGYSLRDITESIPKSIGVAVASLAVSCLIAVLGKWWRVKDSMSRKVNRIDVSIRQGDIFNADGWKVIGFNDYFDTTDDDKVVAHSTLHGKLLKKFRESGEMEQFKSALETDNSSPLSVQKEEVSGRGIRYPLGCVKTYRDTQNSDWILLALTRFNAQDEAHTDRASYENCLRSMWKEIGRVYSGRPIFLPLLGSGLTRFDGVAESPDPNELLRCMICTLRSSGVQIIAPITILVYNKLEEINLYDLKGV